MSPRSKEFMEQARERIAAARDLIETDHAVASISSSYYAMLYAARAALSERDQHAKTHSGTWAAFSRELVATAELPRELARLAADAQRLREGGDYDAASHDLATARELAEAAERFVDAVEGVLE